MDLETQLKRLARLRTMGAPVVSVYLNTSRTDEHEPDRSRIFLKNELHQARQMSTGHDLAADLDWIQVQAEPLLSGSGNADTRGVALFACETAGLREIVPVRFLLENTFAVGPRPSVRRLAVLAHEAPATVVVFVDAARARLVRLATQGPLEEITLENEVSRREARSEWARVTQDRYQQHLQAYRDRHLDAVAESLLRLVEQHDVRWIVLAGEARSLGELRSRLPRQVAVCVLGEISGARYESATALADRAAEMLRRLADSTEAPAVDAALTEAAKKGRAVAGLGATLAAVNLGAVHRLYLLEAFKALGRACKHCQTLHAGDVDRCEACGGEMEQVELGNAMINRALATGSTVDTMGAHEDLERAGGVAAWLHYPLPGGVGGARR